MLMIDSEGTQWAAPQPYLVQVSVQMRKEVIYRSQK